MNLLHKLLVTGVASAAVCFSAATTADVKVGDKMPNLKAGNLYNNTYGLELNDLKGYVVIVEFWATWCGPCITAIPHLNKLYEEYKEQGVVLISLSNEGAELVAPFVKKHKMKYLVGDGSTSMTDFGVRGIPAAFLIDPEGIVRWAGHPMGGLDNALSNAVKKYPPTRQLGSGPIWNANLLTKIEKALQTRDYASARANLRRIDVASLNPDDKKDKLGQRYAKVKNAISKSAEADLAQAVKDVNAKRYGEAIATLKKLSAGFTGMPIGKKAAELLQKLEKDPAVTKARRGSYNEKLAANALKRAKGAIRSGDKITAYRRLVALVEKYEGTLVADDAGKLIDKLEADEALMKQVKDEEDG